MGIKLKITLGFSVVFILLSLLFNLIGYRRIRDMLIEDGNRYLLSRADVLLDKTEIDPVIIPLPDKNSFIRVLDGGGRELFASPGILSRIATPTLSGVSDTLGMRVAYVRRDGAALVLAVSNSQLQTNLRLLLSLMIVSSTLSVLISGLVSYILARKLHELSVTINDMMHRIDESLQQQQNFFGSASHELKTPLAILRTELEVGLRKPGLEDGVRHLLSNQLEEISRLQEIVNEFLVVSQLRVGAPSLYRRPFDLSVLVVKVYNQLLPLLRQKNLEPVIRFDEEAADFIVNADEDKIRIVLLNLLENAAKYGVKDTAILCKVERTAAAGMAAGGAPLAAGGELTVEFTNVTVAVKVSTENLQVAFYRSDLIQRGAGLGLWLCNEIIRLHEGRIAISSGDHRFTVKISLREGIY
ncbi:MAG TPA: HAMP domain-containing sensor histidine kinase [Puia sp.]|nr:HAMP domain-containing sensor histidine kinase [Puia sp.]